MPRLGRARFPGKKAVDGDTKARSMRHALARGYFPETDDVADALCIAEYVLGGYLNLTAGVADSVPTDEANDDATSASAVSMGARA